MGTAFCSGTRIGLKRRSLKSAAMKKIQAGLSSWLTGEMSMMDAPLGKKMTLPAKVRNCLLKGLDIEFPQRAFV